VRKNFPAAIFPGSLDFLHLRYLGRLAFSITYFGFQRAIGKSVRGRKAEDPFGD
jgi:hypothetical protein